MSTPETASLSPPPPGVESDEILKRLLELHPKIIDLTLERVLRLLSAAGDPQTRLPPVVHVAGTNGKGSTLAMIRAGLEAQGEVAHAYTSPHLARFNERVRIAGSLIDEASLTGLLEECERLNDGLPITFFEITTVAALLAFARAPADWTLLEVGLGGRLDATNVVDAPAYTVITPVSFDHQQYLGETLDKIAAEKAGVIKARAPCVVGPQQEDALSVIKERAAEVGARLHISGRDWAAHEWDGGLVFEDGTGTIRLPRPVLPGSHQIENAGAALALLRLAGASEAACDAAMRNAEWPARLQRLTWGPLADIAAERECALWLDGGHNLAAGDYVARHWKSLMKADPPNSGGLSLVCGMLDTKDCGGFLACFAGMTRLIATVDIPGAQSGVPAGRLAALAGRANAVPASDLSDAVAMAADAAGPNGRVMICGSLYLAGAVLRHNG